MRAAFRCALILHAVLASTFSIVNVFVATLRAHIAFFLWMALMFTLAKCRGIGVRAASGHDLCHEMKHTALAS